MPGTMSIGGLSSGMKTDDIIAKYMDIARRPQKRTEDDKARAQQKLVAWQDLNTRVLALQTKSDAISSATSFQTKKATSSMSDIASVSASADATAGTYYVNVNKSAKSHQIASQSYSGLDSSVSEGTIRIIVDSKPVDVNITSANNTLVGVKDAINKANAGVRASVINQGTASNPSFTLMLTSDQTGSDHKMTVSAGTTGLHINTGQGAADDATVVQTAEDAEIQLGSLKFTRSTNTITDVIPGVTLNVANPDPAKTVKIDVTQDTEAAKKAVNGFVEQYNDIMKTIKDLTMYDSQSGESGLLLGNYQLQSLQMDLESMVTSSVPEIPIVAGRKNYNALSAIGITTGLDGLLTVNDSDLSSALQNNAADVGKLFGTTLESESSYVTYVSSTSDTKASGAKGYDVSITQAATRATVQAGTAMNGLLGQDETLTLNDKQVLLKKDWSLSDVINEVNRHSLETNISAFDTIVGTDHFLTLRTLQYGSQRDFTASSSRSITEGNTSGLGNKVVSVLYAAGEDELAHPGSSVAGLDVAGTINGEAATGKGQVLTATPENTKSPVAGLQVLATNTSPLDTKATFIKGVGTRIKEMLSSMTSSTGVFTSTQNSLNSEIDAYTKDIADMEERLQAQQDRMYSDFNRMESQLATLNNQGSALSQQLAGLSKK